MALQGPAGFADDGRAVLERTVDLDATRTPGLPDKAMTEEQLAVAYDIERTAACILANNYQRIALQMPDGMLRDAAWVAQQLSKRTGRSTFILADTSYGSCCVDEIAAQHVDADFIVHYGPSCLSATQRLPVMYVFGRGSIDIKACATAFDELYGERRDDNIVIVGDVIYEHAIDDLVAELRGLPASYTRLMVARALAESSGTTASSLGRNASSQLTGRQLDLPAGLTLNDCRIFYIGEESRTLTNLLMTNNKAEVHSFAPTTNETRLESASVNRALMKRYYLVQKAKDADVIGIVAGTLGVVSYMQVIEHLKQMIRKAGKKFYFFSVGKLNVAKLANFPEIDIFVLVACPENSLIDGKEFYRPVITPFELDLALVSGREWTGAFVVHFKEILARGEDGQSTPGQSKDEDGDGDGDGDDGDVPQFSLVSGQLRSSARYAPGKWHRHCHGPLALILASIGGEEDGHDATEAALDDSLSSLTLRNQHSQVATWRESPAAKYLAQRDFQGLEQRLGQDAPAQLEIGRSGIARGYADEPGRDEQKTPSSD
ncbi:putative diphthamide synthesis protein-domain-containing protein [Syncephalis pseudoplumigaleata]|uniref:2-(3-amino-3-carboxypropyl)histidine synthase subunit 2 n=1 Tax=Syncephalis pseudoplumigaleata TaxID=1712513 RepID=A0A4P9Z2Z5_9FUNG|nr:putative diphthamide synthesis protein-domain-containing protein [Syncephalis pseudoplumigaleata]|eukprot:RKP26913.1 putative diphthamide synthesis protein-domain-containing protein [Syncephalis pseudoplumigaleata]